MANLATIRVLKAKAKPALEVVCLELNQRFPTLGAEIVYDWSIQTANGLYFPIYFSRGLVFYSCASTALSKYGHEGAMKDYWYGVEEPDMTGYSLLYDLIKAILCHNLKVDINDDGIGPYTSLPNDPKFANFPAFYEAASQRSPARNEWFSRPEYKDKILAWEKVNFPSLFPA